MFPSISIFNAELSTYGFCAIIGLFAAGILAVNYAKRKKYDENNLLIALLIGGGASLIGSHLLYAIVNYKGILLVLTNLEKIDSLGFLFQCLAEIFGGSVFYGGMLSCMLAYYITLKKLKMQTDFGMDLIGAVAPLFHGFCRIGCFLGGCCYGIESSFGFVMQDSLAPDANGVTRFPVQLLEVALNFALFALLFVLLCKGKFKGNITKLYFILYGVIRFCDEFLRGDVYRGFWGPFSTSQWIALFTIIGSVVFWIIRVKKEKKQVEQPA